MALIDKRFLHIFVMSTVGHGMLALLGNLLSLPLGELCSFPSSSVFLVLVCIIDGVIEQFRTCMGLTRVSQMKTNCIGLVYWYIRPMSYYYPNTCFNLTGIKLNTRDIMI